MDRRHRPFLSLRGWLLAGSGMALACAGTVRAQVTTPAPSASATPWVQAPPASAPTPPPPPRPPKPPKPPKVVPPVVSPDGSPSPEDMKREMIRRRQEEKRMSGEVGKFAPPGSPAAEFDEKAEARVSARLAQLPPEERAVAQRNLAVWRQLSPEEREGLRRQAVERAHQESDRAYQESGLSLDHDQREIFNLRYRQERRKLERELQEKINVERQQRLGEITARLKSEFAGRSQPSASVAPSATP